MKMTEQVLHHRGAVLVRQLRLEVGEAMPWHRDPFHRISIVLSGDDIAIEFRDTQQIQRIQVTPGQVDWDEPTEEIHRGVNVGTQVYEEVTVFLLNHPDDLPQPQE